MTVVTPEPSVEARHSASLPVDRVALVVGVTGDSDLEAAEEARLRSAFDVLLANISGANPNTPVVVMTAFSHRAETLAAEVALGRGLAVIASLAIPAEQYLHEADAAERERLAEVLKRCARVEVASAAGDGERRLFEAAMYVAHHSHLIVAFCEEKPERTSALAADVLKVRMSGVLGEGQALTNLSYAPDVGPVYQIVTPRKGDAAPSNAFETIRLFPKSFYDDEPSEEDFAESLRRLDRYNEDLSHIDPALVFPPTMDGLRDRTGAAADRLQRWTFGFLYALYAIAIVATAAQYTSHQAFKYVMFPIAFVAYKIAQRFDYENRYQDYRTLSEGLRVQSAWLSAGLSDEQADRCYLGMQQKDLQWIRLALRYAYLVFRGEYAGGSVSAKGCQDWIDGQTGYFRTKPRKEERWLADLKRASRVVFWIAIAVSVACFAILYLPALPHLLAKTLAALSHLKFLSPGIAGWLSSSAQSATAWQASWNQSPGIEDARAFDVGTGHPLRGGHHALLVLLSTGAFTLYAAIALLISNYADKRGFAQNVKRYDRMFVVFDRAKRRLAAMSDPNTPAGREIVRDLGRAALVENADWLLTRRERPLSFVT
jgi:hypothetical protein